METMQRRAVLPDPHSIPLSKFSTNNQTIFYSQSNTPLPLLHPEMTGISVICGREFFFFLLTLVSSQLFLKKHHNKQDSGSTRECPPLENEIQDLSQVPGVCQN